jgi:hypothetical protein
MTYLAQMRLVSSDPIEHRLRSVWASFAFALAMMYVPWESLRGDTFYDKDVYLEKFLYLESLLDEKNITTVRDFFFNEALWDILIRGTINVVGIPITAVVGAISFFCLFSFAFFVARRHGAMYVAFLFNPQVVEFAFSQLRMAFAISIILQTALMRRKIAILITVVFACFIHTATVLIIIMYLLSVKISYSMNKRRLPPYLIGIAVTMVGLLIALTIGPLRGSLLTTVGDRRAEYELGAAGLSYASFWMGMLAVINMQKRDFYRSDCNLFSIACISTFVFSTIMGVYATRFISATFPLLISSLLSIARPMREIVILAYLFHAGLRWDYWLH